MKPKRQIDPFIAKLWSAAVLPGRGQDLVDHLLAGGEVNLSDRGRPLMFVIACGGQLKLLELALEKGGDANAIDGISGESVLHAAVNRRDPGLVAALINAGADVNRADRHGNTPMFRALHSHPPVCLEVAALLLRAGARLDVANAYGVSARDLAKRSIDPAVREFVREQS